MLSFRFPLEGCSSLKTVFFAFMIYPFDYLNNFLTVDRFAEYYGFELSDAQELIDCGRKIRALSERLEFDKIYK